MLCIGLLATLYTSLQVRRDIEQDAARQFSFVSDQVTLKIKERLGAYALILQGGAALFAGSGTVDRGEWRAYVERLRAERSVPGVQGIGFSLAIAPEQLSNHVERIRREGFPGYEVRPAGARALYTSIIYLEPFRERNLRAFGFDMFSEPVRRAAMEQARDSGEAALSGKVELVQETGTEVQAGALMYVPVYSNGVTTDTVEQRRAALIGWAYSPYRMDNLMRGILADWIRSEDQGVELRIYDGLDMDARPEALAANLLFGGKQGAVRNPDSLLQRRTIDINGHKWLLIFDSAAASLGHSYLPAWSTLISGLALSGLLFSLMLSVINTRANAAIIAQSLTVQIRGREELLRQSEFRWKFAIEGSGDGLWDWNVADGTVFFTKRWKEMLGHAEDEVGDTLEEWEKRVHPEDKAATLAAVQLALEGVVPIYVNDHRMRCKDGSYKWVLARGMVVSRADNGRPVRMIGTHKDITERKQVEETLRVHQIELETQNEELRQAQRQLEAARARYFDLYELAPVGYTTIGKPGLILQANLNASAVLGAARGALIGKPFSDFVQKEDQDIFYRNRKRLFESEEPGAFELRMVKQDGTRFWAHLAAAAAQEADGASVLRIVLSDISARKRAELELVEARETADAANRAKSDFLSTMSHEIRTPLNGVIGNIQLLEMSELDPEQMGYLAAVAQSSSNLLSLINDILDLSKIEAQKVILEKVDFSLRGCIANVVLTQRARIFQKGLSLKIRVADDVPDALAGDELRVKQILFNLLGNAIKFTGNGGITLSASVRENSGGIALLEISVRDTGIGMSPAILGDLFEPFVQADSSIARKYGGTGLGLAICQRLTKLMGGSISAESTEGAGTIFRVLLPFPVVDRAMPKADATEKPAAQALWAGKPLNILLAEDSQISQECGAMLLKKVGHQVAVAENGLTALAALGREAFDLVLMDIQMPVMTGDEALAVLRERERPSGKHLPVIALTAYALKGDREKFLALGFDGYVSKPMEVDALIAEMKRVLTVA